MKHDEFRADLHCHTTCSDGTYTPSELIALAIEKGLKGLAITDHDNVNAYAEAIPLAKAAGLILGSGIEFSSYDKDLSVHILGYDFAIDHNAIAQLSKKHIQRRKMRNGKILEKLAKHGMEIDPAPFEQKIEAGHPVGRPHIATAMMEKGYVSSQHEAFEHWIGDAKPCFDPGSPISTDETIDVIHEAGGKAFLAHPHFLKKKNVIERLLAKPFDGIECYYAKCTPDYEEKWVKLAESKNLLISGGSDFHGTIKPHLPLGCSWVGKERFDQIFERNRCT